MKKTMAATLTGILFLASGCASTQSKVERAVSASLAPETPRAVWTKMMPDISASTPEEMNKGIVNAMGRNSFTSWMLTQPQPDSEIYALTFSPHAAGSTASYLGKHHTLVRASDIVDLEWVAGSDNSITGSLQVNTPYGLKASLLFHARASDNGMEVDHLAIQKRDSSEIADGWTVFKK